ncbi:hypothetical protein Droror1_Dr00020620 [Drosera rotundifolia]
MVRNGGFWGNVVTGNALIDMYRILGMTDYVYGVFLSVEVLDIISWNSIMFYSHNTGFEQLALDVFSSISSSSFALDLTVTSEERVLDAILSWGMQTNEQRSWEVVDELLKQSAPETLFRQRLQFVNSLQELVWFPLMPHVLLQMVWRPMIVRIVGDTSLALVNADRDCSGCYKSWFVLS